MKGSSSTRAVAVKLQNRGRDALVRRVSIDARALAAFRVALGFLLVLDTVLRSRDLVAFYTDSGVLSRAVLREAHPILAHASLHALFGAAWVQVMLFVIGAGFALALLVGYRTTLATAGSLVLLFSLHARNSFLLNGGDSLLLHLLFWGLFLPLGERWSVDARRDDAGPPRWRIASVASAALLVQVVLVYVVNAALKLRGDLWIRGEAVQYVFNLDQFTVLLGNVLVNYPDLLGLFERFWLGMVVCSVLLVALTGLARAAFAALFVGMHLGMALTLRLDIFPLVSIAGLLPFLPPIVWDAVEHGSTSPRSQAHEDTGERGSTSSRPEADDAVEHSSMSSRLPATVAVESAAPTGIRRRLGWPTTLRPTVSGSVGPTVPATLSTVPETLSGWVRRLRSPIVACLLVVMVVWNAAVLGYVDSNGTVTDDDTPWNMFAPDPMRTVGWYVVPGELASGGRVDAFHRQPIRWDRPPDVAQAYPNDRWRKYLKHLRSSESTAQQRSFAGYLCDRWNRRHDDELVRLTVYYVAQPIRLDGSAPTRRTEFGTYSCSAVGSSG